MAADFAFSFTLIIVPLLLGVVYYLSLPKPIPGIPYNHTATLTPLGDLPSITREVGKTKDPVSWFTRQCINHSSPIVQIFNVPFGRPQLIICDHREIEDILTRRSHEFPRSRTHKEMFQGVIGHGFLNMDVTNPQFKLQRRLASDTMSPTFLRDVAAPEIHSAILGFVRLWRVKAQMAQGHAFEAHQDIYRVFFEAIWSVVFGQKLHTTKNQIEHLKGMEPSFQYSHKVDSGCGVITLPHAVDPMIQTASSEIIDSVESLLLSPSPALHYWFLKKLTKLRHAYEYRNRVMDDLYRKARARLEVLETSGKQTRSAMDLVIGRSVDAAKKGEEVNELAIKDDLFTLIIGGLDTTTATMSWCVKYLSAYPAHQSQLRQTIRSSLPTRPGQQLDPQDILNTQMPFVDAFIEELLRCASIIPVLPREAATDTTILGHHVSAGTQLWLNLTGPSIAAPSFHIKEEKRSAALRAASNRNRVPDWDNNDIGQFKPERWLNHDAHGQARFNINAGPSLPFSAGLKGCFGKRFAYLQLKLMVVLIVVNFELEELPETLKDMRVHQRMTRGPVQTHVRLKAL